MLTAASLLLVLSQHSPAQAGARKEASDAARSAIEDATDRGPATSAAEIPALSKLLEKAGWTPTPELSGVFRPGSIFAVMGDSHALLAEGCISKEPQENNYTSAEMVSLMQAGVSVRAGLGKAEISGGIVKKMKFSTPVQLSVPIIDLQLTAACLERLESLPEAQRDSAYVVRELLRAEIAEQTCGRLDAEGRMVGLGEADAELSAACMQASLEPVGVGYRTVPLNELLAMGAAPDLAPAPPAVAHAQDEAKPPSVPKATGPLAIVFTERGGSCEWAVEDLQSGESASLFASSTCPTEMVWDGGDELYYRDGDALYMLRSGKLQAEVVNRPRDPHCGITSEHYCSGEDEHWLEPRLDAGSGEIRWACWGESETFEVLEVGRDSQRSEVFRNCIGSACVDDDSPISSFGTPVTIKDFELSADQAWRHVDTYADCNEAGDCGRISMGIVGPLAAPTAPAGGLYSSKIIRHMMLKQGWEESTPVPTPLQSDPSLLKTLNISANPSSSIDWTSHEDASELEGRGMGESGFAFWAREYYPHSGSYLRGPVVVCDASCRRRKVVEVASDSVLDLQINAPFVVVHPTESRETALIRVDRLDVTRTWTPEQSVWLLPDGVPAPFGVRPQPRPSPPQSPR